MCTLGYAAVPEVKLLKALRWMELLRAGSLSKDEARRCFGLLVHLVFLDATTCVLQQPACGNRLAEVARTQSL